MTDFLVCISRSDDPYVPSVERFCTECGAEVWMSAGSGAQAEADGRRPICLQCATVIALQGDAEVVPPTPEQLLEVEAWERRQ